MVTQETQEKEIGQEEIKAALKILMKSEGWRILLGHLGTLCNRNEKVKSNLLRQEQFNKALYLQGFIDSLRAILSEAEKLTGENGEKENPSY